MRTKRILSMVVVFCLCLTMLPIVRIPVLAAYDNTHTNTGNQAYDIVAVAQTQIGYQEGANNNNKYGAAFGHNYVAWCAYFVSWCAKEAGISDSIIHRQGIASPFSNYFNIPNTHSSGNYFPKPGDLVFYGPDSDGDHYHVGIVETVNASTGYITTIEGNTNGGGSSEGYLVYRHTRHYQYGNICCYGRPNYTNASIRHVVNTSYGTNFTAYPKEKITAVNILDAYHNQIDSTSWIGTSDKCTIHEVYTDGCCKVTYPLDAGGTKTVYSKISLFNIHTHSYTGKRVYESAHPHAIKQRCVDYDTCGGWIYTGEYYEVKTCEQCWYADFHIGASSVSVEVGESKTISASLSGFLPDSAVLGRDFTPDNDVVSVTIADQKATFTGLKEGTTELKWTVYSDRSMSHVIAMTTIPVTVTTPACTNHSYAYEATTKPTTSATGTLTGTCTKCSAVTTVSLPRLSTTDYTYKVTKTATCTSAGTGQYTWKTTTYGSFWFDVNIAPTGHSYSYKEGKAPTTSASGTLTGVCSECSDTTTVNLPKLNTTDYTYTVMDQPTCASTGTGCYTLKDTTYGNQMFAVSIPEIGHSYVGADNVCDRCGYSAYITGDLTGDDFVDEDDAIFLLQHVLLPDIFPVSQKVDYTQDGTVDEDDAIYLLQHLLLPELFPILLIQVWTAEL